MPNEISINSYTISFIDRGAGPNLVLLPGTLGDESLFTKVVDTLSNRFRVVVPDHPVIKDFDELIKFYRLFFKEVIGEKFFLGGTSVGGWIAQHYAEQYPDDIAGLILSNTFCDNSLLVKKSRKAFLITSIMPWFVLKRFFFNKLKTDLASLPNSQDLLLYFSSTLDKLGKNGLRTRLSWSLWNIHSPVVEHENILLISSEDDPTVPRSLTQQLESRYPHSSIKRFKSGGHFPYLVYSDEYAETLVSFLGE